MTDKIYIALMRAESAHAAASREKFFELELTEGQPRVLYILRRNEGILQKDLAALCGISQPTLTVLLDKLIKREYVRKERCSVSGGKRGFQVFLTGEGKKKADDLEDVVEDLEKRSLQGISKEERQKLLELLAKVEENLS